MNKYYFTFMQRQALRKCYVLIYAKNEIDARECMFSHFGDKWASCYSEEEFIPQIERFGLSSLCAFSVNYLHSGEVDHMYIPKINIVA